MLTPDISPLTLLNFFEGFPHRTFLASRRIKLPSSVSKSCLVNEMGMSTCSFNG